MTRRGKPLSLRQTQLLLAIVLVFWSLIACVKGDILSRVVQNPNGTGAFLANDVDTLVAIAAGRPGEGRPFLPNGTEGRMLDRKFLKGGVLVNPYAASTLDMERDGAVEVILFEVSNGPKRGLRGWIPSSIAQPNFIAL